MSCRTQIRVKIIKLLATQAQNVKPQNLERNHRQINVFNPIYE